MMTNLKSTEFNNQYCALTEKEKGIFKDVTMKLLKVNFLLRLNSSEHYAFISTHFEVLELFFEYLNFTFELRRDLELAYIKSNDDSVINRINKNESLCLLVLRLLYQEKMDEVSLSNDKIITVKELQDKLYAALFGGEVSERVKKSMLNEMLITFKQHNIIYYRDDLNLDNTTITIYPSIEVAMDFKKMDEIVQRLELLKGGVDSYEYGE